MWVYLCICMSIMILHTSSTHKFQHILTVTTNKKLTTTIHQTSSFMRNKPQFVIIIFSASCWNWRGISSSLSVKNFQTLGLDKSKWWVVEFLLEWSKCIEMTAEMHRYQCQCRIIFWWLCYNGAIWSRDHNIDNNS